MDKKIARQTDDIIWMISATVSLIYALTTLKLLALAKISYKLCSLLTWLIIVSSIAQLVFTVSVELLAANPESLVTILTASMADSIQITAQLIMIWVFAYNYVKASIEMPTSLTFKNLQEHQRRADMKAHSSPTHKTTFAEVLFVGVMILIFLQLPLQFLADFHTGNQTTGIWPRFIISIFYVTAGYFAAISIMMGVAVYRIWNKLRQNPGLRYNERIMWTLLFVYITFGLLFLISAILDTVYYAKKESQSNQAAVASYVFAAFRGIFVAIANILLLYLCRNFIQIEQRNQSDNLLTSNSSAQVSHGSSLSISILTTQDLEAYVDQYLPCKTQNDNLMTGLVWESLICQVQPTTDNQSNTL